MSSNPARRKVTDPLLKEVFGTDYALWFSPEGTEIAFMRFDEALVPVYQFPVYDENQDVDSVHAYPSQVAMRYPKPGEMARSSTALRQISVQFIFRFSKSFGLGSCLRSLRLHRVPPIVRHLSTHICSSALTTCCQPISYTSGLA